MPNRILKESICTSETLDRLTAEEERFFYRLLVQCDDFGRMDARPQVVRARCFPLRIDEITNEQIHAWLNRLREVGLIEFYEADGRPYLHVVTWDKHQQRRAKHSKYPDPEITCVHLISSDIKRNQTQSNVPENRETRNENTRNETRETRSVIANASPPVSCDQPVDNFVPSVQQALEKAGILCPSPFEVEKIASYLDDGMELGLVAYACELAALAGKRRTDYINGILRSWARAGIKTLAQARDAERRRREELGSRAPPEPPQPDPEELERIRRLNEELAAVLGGEAFDAS